MAGGGSFRAGGGTLGQEGGNLVQQGAPPCFSFLWETLGYQQMTMSCKE